jgi:hypothetical protein
MVRRITPAEESAALRCAGSLLGALQALFYAILRIQGALQRKSYTLTATNRPPPFQFRISALLALTFWVGVLLASISAAGRLSSLGHVQLWQVLGTILATTTALGGLVGFFTGRQSRGALIGALVGAFMSVWWLTATAALDFFRSIF